MVEDPKIARRKLILDSIHKENAPDGEKAVVAAVAAELFGITDRIENIDLSLAQLLEIEHAKRNR
jgi:hypothetical protein